MTPADLLRPEVDSLLTDIPRVVRERERYRYVPVVIVSGPRGAYTTIVCRSFFVSRPLRFLAQLVASWGAFWARLRPRQYGLARVWWAEGHVVDLEQYRIPQR